MKLTKSRHLSVLVCILTHDGVVTSEYLATFAQASVRTIKNDIQELNDQLSAEKILRIISTRSKGYYVEPIDKKVFQEFRLMVLREYGFFQNYDLEKMTRRLYLVQRILSSTYCRMDELADELFMSKSAIKEDMDWITCFLSSQGIALRSVPGKGFKTAGKETDLRTTMVEAFCSQYHEIKNNKEVREFNEMFYEDPQFYADVRHECLRVIRNSQLSVKDIVTKKMSTYLCLMQNRIRRGNLVHLPMELKHNIETTYEYQVALEILSLPIVQMKEAFPQDEIYWVAIQLLSQRDIDLSLASDRETINPGYFQEAQEIMRVLLNQLKSIPGSAVLLRSEHVFEELLSLFMPIYLSAKYDTNARMRLSAYEELGNSPFSPLALYLSSSCLLEIQSLLQDEMSSSLSRTLITYMDFQLKKVNYHYQKRRLAVASMKGKIIGNILKEHLMERYGNFIEYVHVYNLYEMRRIDFHDYDAIISEVSMVYNFYPIPHYRYDALSIEDETTTLFQEVFIHGYPMDILNHMAAITKIYQDFTCEDEKTFFQLITYKHAQDGDYQRFEQQLLDRMELFDFYCASSGIAMILCDASSKEEECLEVYVPKSRFSWRKEGEAKAIIFVRIANIYSLSDLKMINKVLQILWYNPKYLQTIAEDVKSTYHQIVKEVTKNHFSRK